MFRKPESWPKIASWVVREAAVLSVLFLTSVGIWFFVELADEVREGSLQQVDMHLLLMLRNVQDPSDPLGPPWFEEAARDFTALGGMAVLTGLSIAVCGYFLLCRHYNLFLVMATAAIGAVLLSMTLKFAFDRPRPDLVPHGSYVYTRSFPSGHSMMAATIYLTIGVMITRIQRRLVVRYYLFSVCVLTTLLVGASRVYLGVHWPTDVVAGWLAGSAWAAICYLLATWRYRIVAGRPDGIADEPADGDAAPESAAPESAAPESAAPESAAPEYAGEDSTAEDRGRQVSPAVEKPAAGSRERDRKAPGSPERKPETKRGKSAPGS